MLLSQLFAPLTLLEAKARIEHPEDLLFDYGLRGAKTALQILQTTAHQPQSVSIKFDGCVHPLTVLLTDKGEITIKEIIDSATPVNILTYNFKTGIEEYNVAHYPRINNNNKNWVMIELENGAQLRVTEDHEVFVEGKGWLEAKNLKPGDDIKEYHQRLRE
jgi:hypothetical protein